MISPKISVIVPVYNSERFLHRCIDSILAQSFTDFELLLIDDGSIDSSGAICDEYATKDSRVRVFHKENGGVSSARNLGLDNAQGEWITFVDSDDWIEEHALLSLMRKDDVDLIIGAMSFDGSATMGTFPLIGKLIGADLFNYIASNIDHYLISSPCCKLFNNNIIQRHSLRFNETLCFGEDALFVKSYLLYVGSLISINDVCYHYQDIGDDIYVKYSRSFLPILNYFYDMSAIYNKLEIDKKVQISRHGIIGVVFEMANICLYKNRLQDLKYVYKFLNDKNVRNDLHKRKSLHVKILLCLSLFPTDYVLCVYVKLMSQIKNIKVSR